MANLQRPSGVDIDPTRGSLDMINNRRKLKPRNETNPNTLIGGEIDKQELNLGL